MEPLGTDGLTASAGEEPVHLAVACDGSEGRETLRAENEKGRKELRFMGLMGLKRHM